jgi:metallothionein expression activator
MNTYGEEWVVPPIGESRPQSRGAPYTESDFGFSEVDDFLQQTLTTLQDLDIPMGPQQDNQDSDYPSQPVRRHKKQPSGTAIFGFAGHNRVLSIPGVAPEKRVISNRQVVEPSQVFREPPQQPRQEPILFTSPQQFEAHRVYQDYGKPMIYAPPPPPQIQHVLLHPMSQPPPHRPQEEEEDLIITSKSPYGYKFPPETNSSQHQYMPVPSVSSQGPPRTVQVPVEYLQRLQSLVKNTEGANLDNMMNYFEKMVPPPGSREIVSPQRSSRDVSPVLQYSSSSSSTEVNSREPTPEFHIPPPEQQEYARLKQLDTDNLESPPKQAKFIHTNNSIGLGLRVEEEKAEEPESEFTDYPKTPSPTLASQAKFTLSPTKKGISWTPVMMGDKSLSMLKRKQQEKVSTLPPGEIDQYILGPGDNKTFVCNYNGCGKLFTRRYNVRSHVQTHLSDRPFLCEFEGCDKAFVRQHDLTRHRKIHEEFAFKCDCGKKFSRHDALFRHRARNICVGGLEPAEVARLELRGIQTSVQKKKKPRGNIKVENDQVAKRLEFDIKKKRSKSQDNTPVGSPKASKGLGILGFDPPVAGQISDERDNVFLNDLNFDQFNGYGV